MGFFSWGAYFGYVGCQMVGFPLINVFIFVDSTPSMLFTVGTLFCISFSSLLCVNNVIFVIYLFIFFFPDMSCFGVYFIYLYILSPMIFGSWSLGENIMPSVGRAVICFIKESGLNL